MSTQAAADQKYDDIIVNIFIKVSLLPFRDKETDRKSLEKGRLTFHPRQN